MDPDALAANARLLDELPAIYWRYDYTRAAFTWVSQRAQRMLGFSVDQWLEPGFWERQLHPDDCARAMKICRGAHQTGEDVVLEYRMIRADGEVVWIHDLIRVTREAEAGGALWGVMLDVTEQRRTEDALKFQMALFQAQSDVSLDGILAVSGDRRVLSYNRQFAEMWRIPASVLPMRSDEALLGAVLDQLPDPAAFTARVAELTANPDLRSFEEITLRDGRTFDRYSAPIRREGEWYGRVWFFRDTTERKQMQTRLLLASRMAALGTLAAGVAHEINNPLAFVSGNLDFVAEALATPRAEQDHAEIVEAVNDAREGAQRVARIVRDLKTFSRTDDDEQVGPVDVHQVLETALAMARVHITRRATLRRNYADVPPARGLRSRLGQVFLNLIINAAQAIEEEGAPEKHAITLTTSVRDGRVSVEISDTGVGIPPEALQRIFDPFFTTKPVGIGTGLGLAVCHGILTSLDGDISVESKVGRGTTFRVTLPIDRSEDASPGAPEPAPSSVRRRLLIIDDEPQVLNAMRRLLSSEYEVATERRGADALRRLRGGETWDAILCDLQMPEMSGIDLFEQLQAVRPEMRDRFAFVSAGALSERTAASVEQFDRPVLDKPLDVKALRGFVARLYGRASR